MALFSIPRDDAKYGVTPVENLFIQEYMLSAPGDYVKVYLYALMQAKHPATAESSLDKFAASLALEPQRVQDALRYWQRHGLIRLHDNECELPDVRSAMCDGKALHERMMYQYASLNHELDRITGGRAFSNNELNLIYDWIEVFGFSEEAALALIQYCVDLKGKKFRINYAAAIARDWEKKGIKTPDAASEYIEQYLLTTSPANKICEDLNLRRGVTVDEHRLYMKWTKEWGFSHEAVSAARAKMTGARQPNFKYLDTIISELHDRGLNTAHKILQNKDETDSIKSKVQECSFQLGVIGGTTSEHIAYYQKWIQDYGMAHDAILFACRKASARNEGSFKGAEALISSYARRKLKTVEAMDKDSRLETDLIRVYECAGIKNAATERDKGQLDSWQNEGIALELILQAAEYAVGTERPFAFIARILKNWKDQGITTVGAARKAHDARKSAPNEKKADAKFDYDQRSYKKEELEGLIETFGGEDL